MQKILDTAMRLYKKNPTDENLKQIFTILLVNPSVFMGSPPYNVNRITMESPSLEKGTPYVGGLSAFLDENPEEDYDNSSSD
jgi:hypothetical protein